MFYSSFSDHVKSISHRYNLIVDNLVNADLSKLASTSCLKLVAIKFTNVTVMFEYTNFKKVFSSVMPTLILLSVANVAYAADYEVQLNTFKEGHTNTVREINNFPLIRDDASFRLRPFTRSALPGLYADSRQNLRYNAPQFKPFDQDPRAPNQQRLTYLNVQAALDTMLYGDDPQRKAVHLAALRKQKDTDQVPKDLVNGYGENIGIIDSGVNTHHPNFNQKIRVNDQGGQKYASQAVHGTEVALTAAGKSRNFQGVAPGARVNAYPIDPNNVVLEDVFLTVYRDKVSVANASFVLGDDTSIFPSIRNTFYKIFKHQDAPLYVFAAGNKDEPTSTFSSLLKRLEEDPRIMDKTLVVSGVKIRNPSASLSARNIQFDPDAIACKDVKYNCLSAFFSYDVPNPRATSPTNKFVTSYGTSFSAPQVSGGAALVKQMFPWFDASNIRQALLTTATDIGTPGIDDQTGWGLLNIGAAVRGPAQFAFGDFIADLTNDHTSADREVFYFRNNIFGQYGLVVSDESGSQRTLILAGKDTYKGTTTVKSGNLRLEGSITSQTNINHDGLFQIASTGVSGNIYNNGFFVSFGGKVNGNFVNSRYGIATLTLGQPLTVSGTAKLNGSLVIDVPRGINPQRGKAYLVLDASRLDGEFSDLQVYGYPNAKLYYDTRSGKVAVKFN